MPTKVILDKCIGCGACEEICPGDLMVVVNQKAKCRSERDCWDCMACIKSCPVQALYTQLPYQLGYYTAKLIPTVEKKKIIWYLIDINGNKETFEVVTHNK